jgi:uncharacterized integral membrane protein
MFAPFRTWHSFVCTGESVDISRRCQARMPTSSVRANKVASFAKLEFQFLDINWSERYARLNDEELLHLAGDRRDLLEEAARALDAEMAHRGLTYLQARKKRRDALRKAISETKAHHAKRNKSKYFVAQMNLRAYFIGLLVFVLLLFLTSRFHLVAKEWEWPLAVVYLGILIACLAVQSWVRRTVNFWFSLAISCTPQFFLSHWLNVYHPARSSHGEKGSAFLSILVGWALGVGVFFLLQKLKLGQDEEKTAPIA